MDDAFKIYVEQLRDGHSEKIKETLSPDFLDIHEPDLAFGDDVEIEGEAYLAEENLVLHLQIRTFAVILCSICNEPVKVELRIPSFYHAEPLQAIKGGIFNFQGVLRESILLDTPPFAECNEGSCPKRKEIEKYLRPPREEDSQETEDEGYRPFADLDFDK
jgi:uncharacterized metal-binding protein YceD (DUF177 family)